MKKFFTVSYKKRHSGKLFNIAVFNVEESKEASNIADEWIKENLKNRGYNQYGISKHLQAIGTRLKGTNVSIFK